MPFGGRSPLGLRELKLHHGKGDEATLLVAARLGCVNGNLSGLLEYIDTHSRSPLGLRELKRPFFRPYGVTVCRSPLGLRELKQGAVQYRPH